MATTGNAIEVGVQGKKLPRRIAEVSPSNYKRYSDEALDSEIVESFNAAQEHYTGLRREVVLRLLPALVEMRGRHAVQGTRNDLNIKLGLPKRAGWEDYLRSRGLRPDTVRNWFRKYTALSTLGFLISGTESTTRVARSAKPTLNGARLFRVSNGSRSFIVAATSTKDAISVAGRVVGVSVSGNPRVEVSELGAVIEVSTSWGFEQVQPIMLLPTVLPHPAHEEERDRADLDAAIVTALKKNPSLNHRVLAERFKVTVVTVRRIATRYKLNINPSAGMVSKSVSVNADT